MYVVYRVCMQRMIGSNNADMSLQFHVEVPEVTLSLPLEPHLMMIVVVLFSDITSPSFPIVTAGAEAVVSMSFSLPTSM